MYGKMKTDVYLLGTSLSLQKGDYVELTYACNLPQEGFFARPNNGKWSDGLDHDPDDSILVHRTDFSILEVD
jgi:hypothetical protein